MKRPVRSVFVLASLTFAVVATTPGQAAAVGPNTLKVTADTTLTADFAGNVVVAKDGVTLDCAGYRIIGEGTGRGVVVDKINDVTVRNCDVSNFATGFWVASTSGSTFEGNSSHDNQLPIGKPAGWVLGAGFWLQSSSGNALLGNSIYDNPSDGVDAFNSSNNLFADNTVSGNLAGFFFGDNSVENTLQNNSAALNRDRGFIIADGASNNLLNGNTAQENAGCGFQVDGNVHPSNGNTLDGNTATGNSCGFIISQDAVDNHLTNNVATFNNTGFVVADGASNNELTNNTAASNAGSGFLILNGATGNYLAGNSAQSNGLRGFAVAFEANGNTLDGNQATGNGNGCDLCGGFILVSVSVNALVGNTSNYNLGYGFALFSAGSNTLLENAGCGNSIFDAFQDAGSTLNVWSDNAFCTSSGI